MSDASVTAPDASLEELCHIHGIDAGNDAAIKSAFATLKAVDVFQSVDVCAHTLTHFTALESVSIIQAPKVTLIPALRAAALRELYIVECGLTSLAGLTSCPLLEILNVSGNALTTIHGLERATRLTRLHMNENRISTIEGLEACSELQELSLARNRISTLGSGLACLTSLQSLQLSDNAIASFSEVAHLAQLPRLVNVAFADPHWGDNPMCNLCNYTTYVLYQLPSVRLLDGAVVSEEARAGAESTFLKKRMYYNMRAKTMRRNITAVLRVCNSLADSAAALLDAWVPSLLHALKTLETQQMNCDAAIVASELPGARRRQRSLQDVMGAEDERAAPSTPGTPPAHSGDTTPTAPESPPAMDGLDTVSRGSSPSRPYSIRFINGVEERDAVHAKLQALHRVLSMRMAATGAIREAAAALRASAHAVSMAHAARMELELTSGGNVRLEEGRPMQLAPRAFGTSPTPSAGTHKGPAAHASGDAWHATVCDLLRSRFLPRDFAPLHITGVRVTRIIRVHNRSLRTRFEKRIAHIFSAHPQLSSALVQQSMRFVQSGGAADTASADPKASRHSDFGGELHSPGAKLTQSQSLTNDWAPSPAARSDVTAKHTASSSAGFAPSGQSSQAAPSRKGIEYVFYVPPWSSADIAAQITTALESGGASPADILHRVEKDVHQAVSDSVQNEIGRGSLLEEVHEAVCMHTVTSRSTLSAERNVPSLQPDVQRIAEHGFSARDASVTVPVAALPVGYCTPPSPSYAPPDATFGPASSRAAASSSGPPPAPASTPQADATLLPQTGSSSSRAIPVSTSLAAIEVPRLAEAVAQALERAEVGWSRSGRRDASVAADKLGMDNSPQVAYARFCSPAPSAASAASKPRPGPDLCLKHWMRSAGLDGADANTRAVLARTLRRRGAVEPPPGRFPRGQIIYEAPSEPSSVSAAVRRGVVVVAKAFMGNTLDVDARKTTLSAYAGVAGESAPGCETIHSLLLNRNDIETATTNAGSHQRVWAVLDPALLLPEYIVEYEYVFDGEQDDSDSSESAAPSPSPAAARGGVGRSPELAGRLVPAAARTHHVNTASPVASASHHAIAPDLSLTEGAISARSGSVSPSEALSKGKEGSINSDWPEGPDAARIWMAQAFAPLGWARTQRKRDIVHVDAPASLAILLQSLCVVYGVVAQSLACTALWNPAAAYLDFDDAALRASLGALTTQEESDLRAFTPAVAAFCRMLQAAVTGLHFVPVSDPRLASICRNAEACAAKEAVDLANQLTGACRAALRAMLPHAGAVPVLFDVDVLDVHCMLPPTAPSRHAHADAPRTPPSEGAGAWPLLSPLQHGGARWRVQAQLASDHALQLRPEPHLRPVMPVAVLHPLPDREDSVATSRTLTYALRNRSLSNLLDVVSSFSAMRVQELRVPDMHLQSLAVLRLSELPELRLLDVSYNPLNSLEGLEVCALLTHLDVSCTGICGFARVESARTHAGLTESDGELAETSYLRGCGSLRVLRARGNHIDDLQVVLSMSNSCPLLDTLDLRGNAVCKHGEIGTAARNLRRRGPGGRVAYLAMLLGTFPALSTLDGQAVGPRCRDEIEHVPLDADELRAVDRLWRSTSAASRASLLLSAANVEHAQLGLLSHEQHDNGLCVRITPRLLARAARDSQLQRLFTAAELTKLPQPRADDLRGDVFRVGISSIIGAPSADAAPRCSLSRAAATEADAMLASLRKIHRSLDSWTLYWARMAELELVNLDIPGTALFDRHVVVAFGKLSGLRRISFAANPLQSLVAVVRDEGGTGHAALPRTSGAWLALSALTQCGSVEAITLEDCELAVIAARTDESSSASTSISTEDSASATQLPAVQLWSAPLLSMQQLTRLELSRNSLTDDAVAAAQLHLLPSLTLLALDYNRLTSFTCIRGCKSLMELYMSHNVIGAAMGGPQGGRDADLGGAAGTAGITAGRAALAATSQLTSAALKLVQHLRPEQHPRLIIADFTGNPFTVDPSYREYTIYHLRRLKVLDGVGVSADESAAVREKYSGRLTMDFLEDRLYAASAAAAANSDDAAVSDFIDTASVFAAVRELDLASCRIREIEPLPSHVFRSLTSINLDHNLLSSPGLVGIKDLPCLSSLSANHNKITTLLYALGVMSAEDVTDTVAPAARAATSGSAVTRLRPTTMPPFAKLEVLMLTHNGISSMEGLGLDLLTHLRVLNLANNEITRIGGLQHARRLRQLILDGNNIRAVDSDALSSCQQLAELGLADNSLRSLANLDCCGALQVLNVSTNRVGEIGELDNLIHLAFLQDVNLSGNPIARKHLYRITAVYKLAQISTLDGKDVSNDERGRAELAFNPPSAAPPSSMPMGLQSPTAGATTGATTTLINSNIPGLVFAPIVAPISIPGAAASATAAAATAPSFALPISGYGWPAPSFPSGTSQPGVGNPGLNAMPLTATSYAALTGAAPAGVQADRGEKQTSAAAAAEKRAARGGPAGGIPAPVSLSAVGLPVPIPRLSDATAVAPAPSLSVGGTGLSVTGLMVARGPAALPASLTPASAMGPPRVSGAVPTATAGGVIRSQQGSGGGIRGR